MSDPTAVFLDSYTPNTPPSYSSININQPIKYPIYETSNHDQQQIPDYHPTIHKITLVQRKLEYMSPYEPSNDRSWKLYVMELNSTQINLYTLSDSLIKNKWSSKRSRYNNNFMFDPIHHDYILSQINKSPSTYLNKSSLNRSYSLQHAKFGLPVDYKKRNYCLRIRLETEQMLIQFYQIDELVNWSNFLSIGINVSLDLDSRAMPMDRTVPRRRRRHDRWSNNRGDRSGRRRRSELGDEDNENGSRSSNRNRSYSDSELIRREFSPPKFGSHRRASLSLIQMSSSTPARALFSRFFKGKREKQVDSKNFTTSFDEDYSLTYGFNLDSELVETSPGTNSSNNDDEDDDDDDGQINDLNSEDEDEEEDDDDEDDDEDHNITTIREENESVSNTIQNEEEEELASYMEVDLNPTDELLILNTNFQNFSFNRSCSTPIPNIANIACSPAKRSITNPSTTSSKTSNITNSLSNDSLITHSFNSNYEFMDEDIKWKPEYKIISRRKFLKDSLRCIKYLTNDESWIGKSLVRSAASPYPNLRSNEVVRTRGFVKEFIVGDQGLIAAN